MIKIKDYWFFHEPFTRVVKILVRAFYGNYIDRVFHKKQYEKLCDFKGIHRGKRLFIVATGPSLTLEDVNLLKDEYSFSMNSVYKLFDKTDWRPSYYAIFDQRVFQLLRNDLFKQKFNCAFCPSMNFDWKAPFVHKIPMCWDWRYLFQTYDTFVEHGFSNEISHKVYTGTNVVHVIFQIAAYMGFSEIYILGADCTMGTHSKVVEYKGGEEEKKQALIPNEHIIDDYRLLKKEMDHLGIKVYNATRGGALEVFPRVDLENVIRKI